MKVISRDETKRSSCWRNLLKAYYSSVQLMFLGGAGMVTPYTIYLLPPPHADNNA